MDKTAYVWNLVKDGKRQVFPRDVRTAVTLRDTDGAPSSLLAVLEGRAAISLFEEAKEVAGAF